MTIEMCRDMAIAEHLRYYGVQYGVECYATNNASSPFKYGLAPIANCSMHCAGNPSQRCGGDAVNDVYDAGTSACMRHRCQSSPGGEGAPCGSCEHTPYDQRPASRAMGMGVHTCSWCCAAQPAKYPCFAQNGQFAPASWPIQAAALVILAEQCVRSQHIK
jgi:hypothetical protein